MPSTISVLDLPPEITSVIFIHAVYDRQWFPGFGRERELPTFSQTEAPLLLGRVCRQFRERAWSTPELWTQIEVHCGYFIEDAVPHLERWLSRSGSLPLTMDIKYKAHPETSSDGLLRLLHRHVGQLQDLTLDITPADDLFRLEAMVGPLPALQKIFLTCRSLRYHEGMITGFKMTPELRDVHFLANFHPQNIDLPWGQLTTFRADSLTLPNCLLILSLAPNLVTCRFECRNASGPLVAVPPLLDLKSLILSSYKEPSTDLLKHLTTPALVYLETEELDLDDWRAFLARSQCALDHLTVAGTGWTMQEYNQCLEGISSLSELEVRRVGPSFYEIVRLLKGNPRFLPNLKSFREDLCGKDSDWPRHKNGADLAQLVVEMLETRWDITENTRLQRFELHTTKGFIGSSQLSERLQALKKDGMDIYIAGSTKWAR